MVDADAAASLAKSIYMKNCLKHPTMALKDFPKWYEMDSNEKAPFINEAKRKLDKI